MKGHALKWMIFLVHAPTTVEHDKRLSIVLQKLQNANTTLNSEKCEFAEKEVHYLGHLINAQGISADPEKVKAITNMAAPTNITGLR